MDTRKCKAKAVILTLMLLIANGAAMAQQYCPIPVHFNSTQGGGQLSACNTPFVIQAGDGGGDVTVCSQIFGGDPNNTITINDSCLQEIKAYNDVVVTHTPGVNDINPFVGYSYDGGTQTATIYGHYTVVHFKFGNVYTWHYDHGVAGFVG